MIKRFALILISIVLLLSLTAPRKAGAQPWQAKVDQALLQYAPAGDTEFLVVLKQQADLSGAALLGSKSEKGQFVYQQLSQTAANSQGPIVQVLAQWPAAAFRSYWVVNMIWVRGSAELLQNLAQRSDVAYIAANQQAQLAAPKLLERLEMAGASPSASAALEWGVARIRAPEAWAAGYTGQGVVVAGADTGYDWDHPALLSKYRGWDGATANHNYHWHDAIHAENSKHPAANPCGLNSPIPCDDYWHGTHTMGTMVGDDGAGNQIGVAPGAKWIGCRNMDSGWGTPTTYAECYQWFIAPTDTNDQNPRPDLAPDVINNSWSCLSSEGCDPVSNYNSFLMMNSVVESVRAAGILTVHSAGNSGSACYTVNAPGAIYPASFTVGAMDYINNIASFSSRGTVTVDGSNRLKPEISAPGVSTRSCVPGTGYNYSSGTSMAAPHVAGAAALVLSAVPVLKGQVAQIETVLAQNAVPFTSTQTCGGIPGTNIPNSTFGWGRVDAWNAINAFQHSLTIQKTLPSIFYNPGEVLTYTLLISNHHPFSVTHNVVVTDLLPANTQFIAASTPYTLTDGLVEWGFPAIQPGQTVSATLAVQVDPSASAPIVNQDYGVRSDETQIVMGLPVRAYKELRYYFPFIGR
jgi:uncharacterized repeat protein (TIGR01451 family)